MSKYSVHLTNKVIEYTKTKFCYGHRNWTAVTDFDESVLNKPRATCKRCQKNRKANVKT